MIDFLAKRDIIEQIIPSDATSIGVVSGVSGAWSAYTELITAANLTYPFILCGVYVYEYFLLKVVDGLQYGLMNIQVNQGAAGHEGDAGNLLAEGHGLMMFYPGTTATDNIQGYTGRTIFFEPILIPANTRISFRTSCSAAKAMRNGFYLFGYNATSFANPTQYIKELRYIRGLCPPSQGSQVWPSPGLTTVITDATTSWVYGSPVQFIASAANPILITGIVGLNTTANNPIQAQIGIGAAGSEIWMSKVGMPGFSTSAAPLGDCYLARPLFVKTGEAVSVKIAGTQHSNSLGMALKGFNLK